MLSTVSRLYFAYFAPSIKSKHPFVTEKLFWIHFGYHFTAVFDSVTTVRFPQNLTCVRIQTNLKISFALFDWK